MWPLQLTIVKEPSAVTLSRGAHIDPVSLIWRVQIIKHRVPVVDAVWIPWVAGLWAP